jgi:hypothetical protein
MGLKSNGTHQLLGYADLNQVPETMGETQTEGI